MLHFNTKNLIIVRKFGTSVHFDVLANKLANNFKKTTVFNSHDCQEIKKILDFSQKNTSFLLSNDFSESSSLRKFSLYGLNTILILTILNEKETQNLENIKKIIEFCKYDLNSNSDLNKNLPFSLMCLIFQVKKLLYLNYIKHACFDSYHEKVSSFFKSFSVDFFPVKFNFYTKLIADLNKKFISRKSFLHAHFLKVYPFRDLFFLSPLYINNSENNKRLDIYFTISNCDLQTELLQYFECEILRKFNPNMIFLDEKEANFEGLEKYLIKIT